MLTLEREEIYVPVQEQTVFLIINRQMTPLDKRITCLGRQMENDIVFYEESVSRFHAEIRYENGKYVLYDNNSTAGSFVNGKRVFRFVLNSGDQISIAHVQVTFVNNSARLSGRAMGTTQSLHE